MPGTVNHTIDLKILCREDVEVVLGLAWRKERYGPIKTPTRTMYGNPT